MHELIFQRKETILLYFAMVIVTFIWSESLVLLSTVSEKIILDNYPVYLNCVSIISWFERMNLILGKGNAVIILYVWVCCTRVSIYVTV